MCIEKYIQTKSYKILLGIGLIAIFFGSTVNSWAQNQRQTIQITTEFNYPYNFLDKDTGAISGRAADKVHEIFKRSQIPYRMQIMSWNRAFEMARGNADTCVFSTSRSGEREPFFHWIGPIAVGHWAIFGSPDKLGKITKLEDIKQSRIGTQFGTIGVAYLTERHFQVVTSTESITTFKNVAVGRIDYATTGDSHGKKIIKDNQLGDKVVWLFNYNTTNYYLACNAQMPTEIISILNTSLRELKADGTFEKIDNRY